MVVMFAVADISAAEVKNLSDQQLPDYAKAAYLAKLAVDTQNNMPTTLNINNLPKFLALATRGLMYSTQSPYPLLVARFAMHCLQANEFELRVLATLLDKNFSVFKKTIKNRAQFFDLLQKMVSACEKIVGQVMSVQPNNRSAIEAISLVANFAQAEALVYQKVHTLIAPQLENKTIPDLRTIKSTSEIISKIFEELDVQLHRYVDKYSASTSELALNVY
jgi:hypothetical protein